MDGVEGARSRAGGIEQDGRGGPGSSPLRGRRGRLVDFAHRATEVVPCGIWPASEKAGPAYVSKKSTTIDNISSRGR
jgi:hypothetical protein